jgi:hypothetical protein
MTLRTAVLLAAVALLWGGYLFLDAARAPGPPAEAVPAPGAGLD